MDTLFIGHEIVFFDTIDSTNSYANQLLKEGKIAEGLVIRAGEQTAGRGQRGRTWEGKARNNLTISIVLYPALAVNKQFLLTQVVALGVADFMAGMLKGDERSKQVKIKWPNDIYYGNAKVAGILIENTLKDQLIASSVVGIGVNINQTEFLNAPNPTSLKQITGDAYSLDECLKLLCSCLEKRYLQLRSGREKALRDDYLVNLYRKEIWAPYHVGESQVNGKILGVSATGKLQVKIGDQDELREFDFKEIAFIV